MNVFSLANNAIIVLFRYIRNVMLLCACLFNSSTLYADEWFNMRIYDLFVPGAFPDILPPTFSYGDFMNSGTIQLDVTNSDWVNVGASGSNQFSFEANKLVKLEMFNDGVYALPSKYQVLWRIDARFSRPQVFIAKYDYKTATYHYDTNDLLQKLNNTSNFTSQVQALKDYFYFQSRSKISVKVNDLIYISLTTDPFNITTTNNNSITGVYTNSTISNKIIYTPSVNWCNSFYPDAFKNTNNTGCVDNQYFISPTYDNRNLFFGNINDSNFSTLSLSQCTNTNQNTACYYAKGTGMSVALNDTIIKDNLTSFAEVNSNEIFRYQANASGFLDFTTTNPLADMFPDFANATIENWQNQTTVQTNYDNNNGFVNFLHFGSYVMYVEIGSGQPVNSSDALEVQWYIGNNPPNANTAGTLVGGMEDKFDAPDDGNLWLRVINTNANLVGNISVNYAGYNKSDEVSKFLENTLINPLVETFNQLTQTVYSGLQRDPFGLVLIAQTTLIMYIILFGMYFLLGAAKITALELVKVIVKISLVNVMFTPYSWSFFHDNFFSIFLNGSAYLITSLTDVTSSANNVFGFLDPLLAFYFSSTLWAIIGIEFLSFTNGYTIFAILLFITMMRLLLIVLTLVTTYVLGILATGVLISLAPLFIIFLIFERTTPIFKTWVSTLFQYLLQPVLIFLFFLVIQQIIIDIINSALPTCAWQIVLPFSFNVNLAIIGIDYNLQFGVPFLPGIAFFTPVVNAAHPFLTLASSTFLLYVLGVMIKGFINYTSTIAATLTSTTPSIATTQMANPGAYAAAKLDNAVSQTGNAAWSKIKQGFK